MLRGQAEILADGAEHDDAQSPAALPLSPARGMQIAHLPVIAVRIDRE